MQLEAFLKAIPKVELHCHLYGAVREETFLSLAERHGAPLSAAQVKEYYTRPRKPWPTNNVLRSLDEYLIKSPDDLHRITLEYIEDISAHNVRYAEFFWNPNATADSGLAFREAQAAIVAAIREGGRKFGTIARVVPAIDRERRVEDALEMVRWVLADRQPETLGIGMDFNEVDGPAERFIEAYRLARDGGLHVTAHAGENGVPFTSVRTALLDLGIERVDHGYTVLESPELMELCLARGTIFTVIPTNSFYLRTLAEEKWSKDHPIREMVRRGLRVHPNTDNPTLHKVSPTAAWLMMMRDFGCSLDDARGFLINGLDAAWIDPAQRDGWKREWTKEFDRLRAEFESSGLVQA